MSPLAHIILIGLVASSIGQQSGPGYQPSPPSGYGAPPGSSSGYGAPPGSGSSYGSPQSGSSYGGQSGSGYGSPQSGSSYGSPQSGYGSRSSSYGSYIPRQPYYPPPPPPVNAEEPLDLLDALWNRLDVVDRQNKNAGELLDSLESQLSLAKKFTDELEVLALNKLDNNELQQNNSIDRLKEHLDDLNIALNTLDASLDAVEPVNAANAEAGRVLSGAMADERKRDALQDNFIARLHSDVKDFKRKMFTILDQEFAFLGNEVGSTATGLKAAKRMETARMCETGTVTIRGGDNDAVYDFDTDFPRRPNVVYSIAGLTYNVDSRADPIPVGYGPPPKEPNRVGAVVLARATRKSVTFKREDKSFGDTAPIALTVSFQACNIGPGTELSDGAMKA